MKHCCLPILLLLTNLCLAQSPRIAHWYFANQAGIDFSSGTAVADLNGKLTSIEGSSTMSDLSGNLLFYSNGEKVWNRNHAIMAGGDNLVGDQSSTESSLIVPAPGSDHLYYLFTSVGSAAVPSGLYYNTIDMNLNGGLGGVTAMRNLQLFSAGTEQLAGTQHCNNTDYWIVGREKTEGTLRFYAYKLSKDGLSAPVISEFNVPNHIYNTIGSISFSQDGKLMAFTSFGTDTYVFDFNTTKGTLALKASIGRVGGEEVYSNAISPDNTKLYTTSVANAGYNYLTQYDLMASDVTASRVNLDSIDFRLGSPNSFGYIGQIRLASDQRIYVSRWNQTHPYQIDPNSVYSLDSIDVINKPNLKGRASQPQRNFLFLHGRPTMLGLPNFISNYTSPAANTTGCPIDPSLIDFVVSGECQGADLKFTYTGPNNVSSIEWYFGDPGSGPSNTSIALNPTHTYSAFGEYLVNLTAYYTGGAGATTVTKTVKAVIAAPVELGNDTTLCEKDTLLLQAPDNGSQIKWQDNSTAPSFVVRDTGTYRVTVTKQGCAISDSIHVNYILLPKFSLGPDQPICGDEKIFLKPRILTDTTNLSYTWQNGSPEKTFTAASPGLYILNLTNTCGAAADTVKVEEGYCTLKVPSAFTPNGDGHNDVFKAKGDQITKFDMTIYNRWGQRVFESKDINQGWDGYLRGRLQPPGAYIYTIIYSDQHTKDGRISGTLTLIY